MVTQPQQNLAPLSLLDPVIPGRTQPILPDLGWGINLAAARLNFPEKGLQVQIPIWPGKAIGDSLKLFLNHEQVDQHTIADTAETREPSTLWVPPKKMESGSYELTYEVKQFGQKEERPDQPLKLYVKLELPGGQDTDPGDGHSNLSMSIPQAIIDQGVDKAIAEKGFLITILLYPLIAVGDVIIMSWGGFLVQSTPVTAEQISDPANHPIQVEITPEVIARAGDTNETGLAVSFMVRDIVGNQSQDWSKATRIFVSTATDLLDAPIVHEAFNNVLDIDKLGDNDITVQVTAKRPLFELDDVIYVRMRGTTVEGETIEVVAPTQTIDNLPHNYDFKLPIAAVRRLVKTQIVFSFWLQRPGSSKPLRSRGQFVNVIGEAKRLSAPIAEDAQQGALDPDLPRTRIRIPFDELIKSDTGIKLLLLGTRPDGSTYLPDIPQHVPDDEQANDPNGFFIVVEGTHLKTVEGGTLEFWYLLLTDENGQVVERESVHAAVLQVGEPQFELIKPSVEGEKDGALEPNDLPFGTSVLTCPRPIASPWQSQDQVTYTWTGENSGTTGNTITLNAVTAGGDLRITLSVAFVATHIEPNRGKTITVRYQVLRFATGKISYSNPLVFTVGQAQEQLLDPAKVREAPDGVLDPADVPVSATVLIAANRAENAGDHFYMKWRTADGSVNEDYDKTISGNNKGKEVEFGIARSIVLASLNQTVTLSYHVELFEGGTSTGEDYTLRVEAAPGVKLPVATFREASGPQKDQINPHDVYPLGATVIIAASAALKSGDQVHIKVEGNTTFIESHTVLEDQEDNELAVGRVNHAFIVENLDRSLSLTYTVTRKAGGTDGPSDPTVYDVREVIGAGLLKVMGARFNRSTYRSSGASHVLSAFNATSGQPLQAQWKYPDDSHWTTASTWYDTHPEQPLQVRTTDDALTLNPANIFGNGNDQTLTGQSAYVAHRNVGDVVGWGLAAYGAAIPSTIITMDDIVEVSCTRSAFAARRANSAVVVWGTAAEGGSMAGIAPLGFKQVVGNSVAFAGLKLTGQVVAWGDAANGGTVPDPVSALSDITQVVSAGQAFAALRATGHVVAWGLETNGGSVPGEIAGLTDIKTLIGSFGAFAAHRANGRIVGWGNATYGGDVPAAIAVLTDIIELSCANAQAFVARRATGQVVAWGTPEYGGTIDPLIEGLTDIVEVSSTWRAFAARRGNGRVVAWGRPAEGGSVPGPIATLDDIVQVCGSSQAFAALRKNGTVVAWGDVTVGGDTTPVADQLINVVTLYSNTTGFTALTSDGRVVTWGVAGGGGDSSTVQELLRGKVSYLATAATRGLALKASRRAMLYASR
ncbi:hypothetical protein [Pseudomonas koreensis]|uniref:RCC1 domain-containing protein n=1 Tax=Pseudomonas koreensis TaxID=198620 RepID=UPI003D985DF4